jgi:isoprene synthase
MGLAPRLNFGRDRLMECYFWAIGMTPFETKFTDVRKGLTKVASLITLIDDIYDVYGTLDELQLFTKAVERYSVPFAEYVFSIYLSRLNFNETFIIDISNNQ